MNKLEKKSFYSFLALYLGSSLLFVLLSGFWYYSAQKNALENTTYYKLQHLADKISSLVINAHMTSSSLNLPKMESGYEYMLIKSSQNKVYEKSYFEKNGFKVFVSSAPQKHLSIEYVVTKTDEFHKSIDALGKNVLLAMVFIFITIGLISWMLSRLFMRPIHQKVKEIEDFVQDISHELNTPITALGMSSKRAIQKGVYDEKILRNISISTKQLYSIYQSLAYLSFSEAKQESELLNLLPVLERSIKYYSELTHAKNINIQTDLNKATLTIVNTKVELLFSNLISNAIKYSMPDTNIHIILKEGFFSIEDEGVGIEQEKLDEIFELYNRSSNLAGGFGVGLSIVKEICDEFQININVTSELEKGSRFELSWLN
ncbi:HAMP domain-containing sensor histidine kinase [Sulfurimonas sp.]|uniref:sensor histidine kinase n=1 Tax=Sulfurimonas sp. TaxID=2022749 RepID=UPI002AAF7CD0|nr:HAMP domain-containing sensor histidine kinase [Sulfurimonas sp.]